ncbi:MAG: tetratricopeptide repeat protein [Gemmataceae bacterium]|nr:tetratricopeptide repeat protein [Gemmataceae bacterium]
MVWYGVGGAVALVVVLLALWWAVGRWPRRRRAYRRALHLLHQNQWRNALDAVRELQALAPLPASWEGRARNAEGECQRAAAAEALTEKKYEESLEHFRNAARLLNVGEAEDRKRVVDAILAEIYRVFALTTGPDTDAVQKLLTRLLLLHSPCPEASFWQGLCQARSGQMDLALQSLHSAHEGGGKGFIDPPLYLGILLLRGGQAQEALRYLGDANRLDAHCPFVSWQLGQGIVASGGDAGLAVRALQRALGPKGLPQWARTPEKVWREGLPGPERSYVARLAAQQRYVCPVLGADVAVMIRAGFLALAQAHYRQGNYQESANIGNNLLQETAPSLPVLRTLGLALTRLGRYDEAFKHLRAAHDLEEPKTALTAGYLALCGALGKPSRAEDKANNVLWAARLLGRFHLTADTEWADIHRAVFGEARQAGVPLTAAEVARACDVLASVNGADPQAAAIYDHLASIGAESLQPVHAWLYARAAQEHDYRGSQDLTLFALAFHHAPAGRGFFAERQWNFDEMEATFLARWAEQNPGAFPEVLGPDYPRQGEKLLLNRSQQQETAGQSEAALASVLTLIKLAPHSARAHDRWACLEFRRGDLDQAAQILADWQQRHPADPWPHIRGAVLEQRRGNTDRCTHAIENALRLTRGPFRAEIAFLGARLALANAQPKREGEAPAEPTQALRYLDLCLHERPDHSGALGILAALRWMAGNNAALVSQAVKMNRPNVKSGRFQYLAAVCQLAAGDFPAALDAADRAAADATVAVESQYLIGLAQLQVNNRGAAVAALKKVAQTADSPSANHARALLGRLQFQGGAFADAVHWWKQLDPARRSAWKLDDALKGTLFLSALEAYQAGHFDLAAERYREAGKQGYRERRLGALLVLALFKAGQKALFDYQVSHVGSPTELDLDIRHSGEKAAGFLGQALQAGSKDPNVAYLLALACKRQGKIADARTALRRIAEPDANIWLQMGLLSLQEKVLEQAEQEFLKAWELDPAGHAAGVNLLLTRLSLGQTEWAAAMVPQVVERAASPEERRLLESMQALLWMAQSGNGDGRAHASLTQMSFEDEQRLLDLIRSLGNLDTIGLLLRTLESARPTSPPVREAHFEAVLLKGRKLLDRCDWVAAEQTLAVLVRQREVAPATLAALFNLLGCCACLSQDFDEGGRYLSAAVRLKNDDAGMHQNLALANEWQKNLAQAEPHWNRYFDLLERRKTQTPGRADYFNRLAFEGLHRLAGCYTEKEKWGNALPHVERAQRLKPDDGDTLERLFHLYCQVRRPDDARRTLQQLRYLRPGEGQFELYELDLVELREIDDIDRWIERIGQIAQRHPGDARVEERAVTMIGNVVPVLGRMSDQLTDQVNKVIRQVRSLQNYQINWQAVHDVMRDLKREFQKLRKAAGKCQNVVAHPEHKRVLRDLCAHLDRKIEFCREWQGN